MAVKHYPYNNQMALPFYTVDTYTKIHRLQDIFNGKLIFHHIDLHILHICRLVFSIINLCQFLQMIKL